jgi:small ligand-binding sensory domain FIST
MRQFSVAHAAGGEWGQLAKACADTIGTAGSPGNLGFLYVTDVLAADLGSILTFLRERLGIDDWVGTVGIGICATGREYYDEPAIAVMTAQLPEGSYRLLPEIDDEADIARLAPPTAGGNFLPGLAIVHGDPRNPDTPEILAMLAESQSCFLVGGLSSSRTDFGIVAGRVMDSGMAGVILSADIPVAVGLSQGCTPIGPMHTITQAEDNLIIELDGQSALDVLLTDLDPPLAEDLAETLVDIHAALPVEGSDTGDYLVRNLMGVGPEQGWLAIGENAVVGDQFMFCRRDAMTAAGDLRRMLRDLKRRAGTTPRGGVYFSCVARGANLFEGESEELAIIRDVLGDVPLVGFFGNGEISHDRLYGYTGVLTLFT